MSGLIYPYSMKSASAKALAERLGIKRAKPVGPKIRRGIIIINWGASVIAREYDGLILNLPDSVAKAANKLQAFKSLDEGVYTPPWTESQEEAKEWLIDGVCKEVVCRTVLNGHSGDGIVIANKLEDVVEAPLYTQYIPKKDEYRIHVFEGNVIFQQKKCRKKDVPDDKVNWRVRNHKNGFIFANKDVEAPEEVRKQACLALLYLGLDFGAVDVVVGTKDKIPYVLEVNTAPGLEGSTLEAYVEAFKDAV